MGGRPAWDAYFLGIAKAVAARGDCTRRQVGALITDTDHRIISTGYNGTLPGRKGCLEGACPRGQHYEAHDRAGDDEPGNCFTCRTEWPCGKAVAPGSSYDTGPGACIALHAEQNALLYAFRSVEGMTMYITEDPCDGCVKLMRGAHLRETRTPVSVLTWDLP
jgi:dCMP deaminase